MASKLLVLLSLHLQCSRIKREFLAQTEPKSSERTMDMFQKETLNGGVIFSDIKPGAIRLELSRGSLTI